MSDEKHILLTIPFSAEQVGELRQLATGFRINVHPLSEDQATPEGFWDRVEILYALQTLPEPEQAPDLHWIQFHFAGVEGYLDEPILRRPDLQATTLSGANAPQVAEHALALMLALSHNLPKMLADQAHTEWSPERLERYLPTELIGSTVGIIGYGSIGQRLARLLQSCGVSILASKRDLMSASKEHFQVDGQGDPNGELVRRLYPGKALGSMLKECDYVVVTVPLTAETRSMLGENQLAAMKPGAFLVDVSRGGVVDHDALATALRKGQLAGAGLDVFPEEPLPADSPLWAQPNVIISPHVAGLSPHYMDRAFQLFKENLRRYLAGEELLNRIDLDRGY
jgi:phosphoglycerate dehydrogenase-like enzyme